MLPVEWVPVLVRRRAHVAGSEGEAGRVHRRPEPRERGVPRRPRGGARAPARGRAAVLRRAAAPVLRVPPRRRGGRPPGPRSVGRPDEGRARNLLRDVHRHRAGARADLARARPAGPHPAAGARHQGVHPALRRAVPPAGRGGRAGARRRPAGARDLRSRRRVLPAVPDAADGGVPRRRSEGLLRVPPVDGGAADRGVRPHRGRRRQAAVARRGEGDAGIPASRRAVPRRRTTC